MGMAPDIVTCLNTLELKKCIFLKSIPRLFCDFHPNAASSSDDRMLQCNELLDKGKNNIQYFFRRLQT